jgi:phosphoribosylformylglycinamidine synthase
MAFIANVNVMLKEGIADPQGQTIERALPALGFSGVADVRVGKRIRLAVEAADEAEARERVQQMCERLLANPVIESYEVTLEP